MAIEINTSEYEFSHGKKPRGTGQWGFFFDQDRDVSQCFWANGSFADAKRMAIAWAVTKGHTVIRVAP